jgi:hypothetical protein
MKTTAILTGSMLALLLTTPALAEDRGERINDAVQPVWQARQQSHGTAQTSSIQGSPAFLALPRTLSAGYFCALITSLRCAASNKSMSSRSASRTR